MGPPSSFFLAVVAIIILSFAVLGFISAVNYKNISNNNTEGDSISKDTANSLSTTMIIFGIIMLIIFIWVVYIIFTYDNNKLVDKRDVSLLVEAKESINRLKSVKESYNKLQENYTKFKDKKAEEIKKYSQWDYCPSPRIKLNIKKDTGEVMQPVYGSDGKIEALIIKPAKINPASECSGYKNLDFEVETQPCYVLDENKEKNKPGFFSGKYGPMMSQTLGPMTQSLGMNGAMNQSITSPFQMGKTDSKECSGKFLTRKTVGIPGINLSGKCKPESSKDSSPFSGFANTTNLGPITPKLNFNL